VVTETEKRRQTTQNQQVNYSTKGHFLHQEMPICHFKKFKLIHLFFKKVLKQRKEEIFSQKIPLSTDKIVSKWQTFPFHSLRGGGGNDSLKVGHQTYHLTTAKEPKIQTIRTESTKDICLQSFQRCCKMPQNCAFIVKVALL